jgi:hypothetical protein
MALFAACAAAVAAAEPAAGWDALPEGLRVALASRQQRVVAVYRWSTLAGHPVMQRLASARGDGVWPLEPEFAVAAQLPLTVMAGLPFDDCEIDEIWALASGTDATIPIRAWLATHLGRAAVVQRLDDAGWVRVPSSSSPVFAPPLDPEADRGVLAKIASATPDLRAKLLANALERKRRLCPLDGGWIEIVRPRDREYAPTPGPTQESECPRLLVGLPTLGPRVLMAVTLDVKGNEQGYKAVAVAAPATEARAPVDGLRPDEISARLQRLRAQRERAIEGAMCDLVFTVVETDGGLTLRVDGACPGRFEAETTAATAGMFLALGRVAALPVSTALSEELAAATCRSFDDTINAEATLSTSSLLGAAEAEIAYRSERQRLEAALAAALCFRPAGQ